MEEGEEQEEEGEEEYEKEEKSTTKASGERTWGAQRTSPCLPLRLHLGEAC